MVLHLDGVVAADNRNEKHHTINRHDSGLNAWHQRNRVIYPRDIVVWRFNT